MNIDYSKGLDTLAEIVYRINRCGVTKRVGPDGKLRDYMEFGETRLAPAQQFSNEIITYAAATLLHQTTDVKYASLRTNMEEQLAGKTAYVEIVTDSPDALWPMGGIPFPAYAGIDMSSEPKMKLRMPNEDLSVISVVNSGLWSRLHYIHKAKLTDAGSREVQPNDSTGDGGSSSFGAPTPNHQVPIRRINLRICTSRAIE